MMKLAFENTVTPPIKFGVSMIRQGAYGGDVVAKCSAEGDFIYIKSLFHYLNQNVVIYSGISPVWRGYIHSVKALGMTASLSEVRNAIRARYSMSDGTKLLTGWFENNISIEKYGRREAVLDDQGTKSEAVAKAKAYLSAWSIPHLVPSRNSIAVAELTLRGEWSRLEQLHYHHEPVLVIDQTEVSRSYKQKIGIIPYSTEIEFVNESRNNHLIGSNLPLFWKDEIVSVRSTIHHNGEWLINKIDDEGKIYFWEQEPSIDENGEEVNAFDFKYEQAFASMGPECVSVWQPFVSENAFFVSEIKLKVGKIGLTKNSLKCRISSAGPGEAGISRLIANGSLLASDFEQEDGSLEWMAFTLDKGMWMPANSLLWINLYCDSLDTHSGYVVELDSNSELDELIIESRYGVATKKTKMANCIGYRLPFELSGTVSVLDLMHSALDPLFKSVIINLDDTRTSKIFDGSKSIYDMIKELLELYNSSDSRISVTHDNGFVEIKSVKKPSLFKFHYKPSSKSVETAFGIKPASGSTLAGTWIGHDSGIDFGVSDLLIRSCGYWVDLAESDSYGRWKPTKTLSIFDLRSE